jgi:hypothetical protein
VGDELHRVDRQLLQHACVACRCRAMFAGVITLKRALVLCPFVHRKGLATREEEVVNNIPVGGYVLKYVQSYPLVTKVAVAQSL